MDTSSRRTFLEKAMVGTASLTGLAKTPALEARPRSPGEGAGNPREETPTWYGVARCVTEWALGSTKAYADPFNDIELDVVFTDPQGREQRVPAFWAGEQVWRIRYAPQATGRYRYRTICSDPDNGDLQGKAGFLVAFAWVIGFAISSVYPLLYDEDISFQQWWEVVTTSFVNWSIVVFFLWKWRPAAIGK